MEEDAEWEVVKVDPYSAAPDDGPAARLGLVLNWAFLLLGLAWAMLWTWVIDDQGGHFDGANLIFVLGPAGVSMGIGRAIMFVLAGR